MVLQELCAQYLPSPAVPAAWLSPWLGLFVCEATARLSRLSISRANSQRSQLGRVPLSEGVGGRLLGSPSGRSSPVYLEELLPLMILQAMAIYISGYCCSPFLPCLTQILPFLAKKSQVWDFFFDQQCQPKPKLFSLIFPLNF